MRSRRGPPSWQRPLSRRLDEGLARAHQRAPTRQQGTAVTTHRQELSIWGPSVCNFGAAWRPIAKITGALALIDARPPVTCRSLRRASSDVECSWPSTADHAELAVCSDVSGSNALRAAHRCRRRTLRTRLTCPATALGPSWIQPPEQYAGAVPRSHEGGVSKLWVSAAPPRTTHRSTLNGGDRAREHHGTRTSIGVTARGASTSSPEASASPPLATLQR